MDAIPCLCNTAAGLLLPHPSVIAVTHGILYLFALCYLSALLCAYLCGRCQPVTGKKPCNRSSNSQQDSLLPTPQQITVRLIQNVTLVFV